MDEAAELVDRFLDLENEMSDIRTQLNARGIDPYAYIPENESDSELDANVSS